jgi:hypothetical protein
MYNFNSPHNYVDWYGYCTDPENIREGCPDWAEDYYWDHEPEWVVFEDGLRHPFGLFKGGKTTKEHLETIGSEESFQCLIEGNYSDEEYTLGCAVNEAIAGASGADLPGDIRDLTYDFTHFENSLGWYTGTTLDGVCLFPVVGSIKPIKNAIKRMDRVPSGSVKSGVKALDGKWVKTNENMSDFSKSYQEKITGRSWNESYELNGVKFDGYKGGVLIDTKGNMNQFLDGDNFKVWYTGHKSSLDQANRQLDVANGAPIEWYFSDKEYMEVLQDYFVKEGVTEIKFIHDPHVQ